MGRETTPEDFEGLDLSTFYDDEVEELDQPWEPPGDRYPSRREWNGMTRVDRWRWRSTFGEGWRFSGPRAARTVEDWDALPEEDRTPEAFNALSRKAKTELQDRGLDPTKLEAPVPAGEGGEGTPPAEPELIDDKGAIMIAPDDPMHDAAVKRYAKENEGWLKRYDAGEFDELPVDRDRIEELRLRSRPDLEGTPGYPEAVQGIAAIRVSMKAREDDEAPFVPVSVTHQNLGPRGIRTIERDSRGREREVSRMTAEEVAETLAQEEQDTADDADFGANPLALAISEFQTWSPQRRRAFLEQHPAEFRALEEQLSREAAEL